VSTSAPAETRSRRRLRWLGPAVSLAFVAALIWWALRQEAPRLPSSGPELLAVSGALVLYALNTFLRGERWLALLRHGDAAPTRADAHALNVVGYAANNVLPARAGDALRVVLMAPRAGAGRRDVLGTLLAERLLDVVVLGILFVVLAATIAGGTGLPSGTALAALGGAAAAGGACVAIGLLLLARRGLLGRLVDFVRPMLRSAADLRSGHGAWMLGLSALVWLVETLVWMTAGLAVGLEMSLLEGLYIVALAGMMSLVPSGPGYAGTQDAAAVVGVRAIGATGGQAIAFLVVVRFVLLVPITVLGALLLAFRYGGRRGLRLVRRVEPA
jgi:glycosyltransferase 2 family protein